VGKASYGGELGLDDADEDEVRKEDEHGLGGIT
jgi:hypothetical protein